MSELWPPFSPRTEISIRGANRDHQQHSYSINPARPSAATKTMFATKNTMVTKGRPKGFLCIIVFFVALPKKVARVAKILIVSSTKLSASRRFDSLRVLRALRG